MKVSAVCTCRRRREGGGGRGPPPPDGGAGRGGGGGGGGPGAPPPRHGEHGRGALRKMKVYAVCTCRHTGGGRAGARPAPTARGTRSWSAAHSEGGRARPARTAPGARQGP